MPSGTSHRQTTFSYYVHVVTFQLISIILVEMRHQPTLTHRDANVPRSARTRAASSGAMSATTPDRLTQWNRDDVRFSSSWSGCSWHMCDFPSPVQGVRGTCAIFQLLVRVFAAHVRFSSSWSWCSWHMCDFPAPGQGVRGTCAQPSVTPMISPRPAAKANQRPDPRSSHFNASSYTPPRNA